eukprot:COSAG03_NODE_90_length_13417_cov_11.032512_20_plen_212_part_00
MWRSGACHALLLHCIVMVKFIETIQPSIETINKLNVDLSSCTFFTRTSFPRLPAPLPVPPPLLRADTTGQCAERGDGLTSVPLPAAVTPPFLCACRPIHPSLDLKFRRHVTQPLPLPASSLDLGVGTCVCTMLTVGRLCKPADLAQTLALVQGTPAAEVRSRHRLLRQQCRHRTDERAVRAMHCQPAWERPDGIANDEGNRFFQASITRVQ